MESDSAKLGVREQKGYHLILGSRHFGSASLQNFYSNHPFFLDRGLCHRLEFPATQYQDREKIFANFYLV